MAHVLRRFEMIKMIVYKITKALCFCNVYKEDLFVVLSHNTMIYYSNYETTQTLKKNLWLWSIEIFVTHVVE